MYSVSSVVQILLQGDAFDAELGVFEVEKESGFEAGDVEIAQHLSDVVFVESGHDLWIDDDGFIDDEVRDECADMMLVIVNLKVLLVFASKTLLLELDDECALVELLIQSRFKFIEDGVSGSDDGLGDVGVVRHF